MSNSKFFSAGRKRQKEFQLQLNEVQQPQFGSLRWIAEPNGYFPNEQGSATPDLAHLLTLLNP